jgi:hypothetical protein
LRKRKKLISEKNTKMVLNFFTNFLLAPIVLVVGLIGNLMGIIVISRKELKKIGPVLVYMLLFIFDSLYLGIFSFLFPKELNKS